MSSRLFPCCDIENQNRLLLFSRVKELIPTPPEYNPRHPRPEIQDLVAIECHQRPMHHFLHLSYTRLLHPFPKTHKHKQTKHSKPKMIYNLNNTRLIIIVLFQVAKKDFKSPFPSTRKLLSITRDIRNAQPLQKLEAAFIKFIARSTARPKSNSDQDGTENGQSVRSFGTVLSKNENRRNLIEASDVAKKNTKGNRGKHTPLSVYKDTNTENTSGNQGLRSWDSLPTHKDRNKENTAIPSKWTSIKVPQRPASRFAVPTAPAIEAFVDEPSSELHQTSNEAENTTNLQLKERDEHELKRESELLKENPLRNFPISSFPR